MNEDLSDLVEKPTTLDITLTAEGDKREGKRGREMEGRISREERTTNKQ